jgi:energy-coupling factor transporter ATP-binding protein EcfA2
MTLISSFLVPENEVTDLGLKEIRMSRLGRMVALAGKNGAGKSRILNRLDQIANHRYQNLDSIAGHRSTIARNGEALQVNPNSEYARAWKDGIEQSKQQIDLMSNRVIATPSTKKFKAIRFVPKELTLHDPRKSTVQELTARYLQAKTPGLNGHEVHCLFYIQQLQARWREADHQHFTGSQAAKVDAINEYESFLLIVKKLLNTSLDRNINGEPMLFGKPIPDSGLSDGQKIILQLCTALHAQSADLDNTVFILDEPENHLHPSAAIDLLDSLYKATGNSQIWIATHSIPLLAYVASIDPLALWYVEDGAAYHAGRQPEKVLATLLGTDERINQLNAFTGLPAQLATINYASESLLPPKVIDGGANDPQVTQVQKIISQLAKGGALSLLDFGAGKGRLLEGLGAGLSAHQNTGSQLPDYYAFDLNATDKEACQAVIKMHFPVEKPRYFNTPEEFFSHKDDGSISVVSLCNVLHEISPHNWLALFSAHSLIIRALRDDGYLLIVEDQCIPTGERFFQSLRLIFKKNFSSQMTIEMMAD